MPADFAPYAMTLFVAAFCLAILPQLPRDKDWTRSLVAITIIATTAHYLLWRYTATLPSPQASLDQRVWAWTCLAAETAAFIEMMAFMLIMGRTSDRRPEADRHETRLRSSHPDALPSVDVFIPTYNEGPEVVERSILGALDMDYPKHTVWVLDDGGREWLRLFCERHGAKYLHRNERAHAKAGNMNNGLIHATGDLVAVFDADFVPQRNFLFRTVGFFADPKIGIVQTPQHFFNRDPVQTNLSLQRCWPDEQRLFFDVMAPGRDAWDAAFCCGAGSVIRRTALDEIGGFPTASITEDLLTTLALLRRGYITRYLNERLAQGLAAETLEAFFVQRSRWCRGALQALFLPEGPLGPGLTLFQRFMFMPFSWLIQYPTRILFLSVPCVYLWTGLAPLSLTRGDEVLSHLLPAMIMAFAGMRWLAPNTYLPFVSTVASIFTSFRLFPTVVAGLIRPFGVGFRVTPKGSLTRPGRVDWLTLGLLSSLGLAIAAGLAINLDPELRILTNEEFFPFAAGWAMTNLSLILVASLLCFESKHQRSEERFPGGELGSVVTGEGVWPCSVLDLSMTGARIMCSGFLPDRVEIDIPAVGPLTAQVVRRGEASVGIRFINPSEAAQRKLIRAIFSCGRSNAVTGLHPALVLKDLALRLAG